ncbi:Rieske (2Fe-2S) protein [Actinophytocola sp.]|uniref:Rieske (2Fe-2S) protein n=1 Tax=Actinophytocola sp. TaxID=1872138 RepID=UPI003D6AD868
MTVVDPTTDPRKPEGSRSRRDVLCGLAVALVAPGALVAACGSDDAGNGGGETGGGGTDAGPTSLSDIPDGGGLVVDNPSGGKALLVRNGQEVKAYDASCTHMGTIVGVPKDGVSTCPNHGSKFNVDTGAVVNGPATKPLQQLDVQVNGDQVVLA